MSHQFNFRVHRCLHDYDYENGKRVDLDPAREGWGVSLPHQCDDWVISAHVDHQQALDEMDAFIAAAQAARELLAARKPTTNADVF